MKEIAKAANEYLFVFFMLKESDLKYGLRLIAILIYERIENKGSLDF